MKKVSIIRKKGQIQIVLDFEGFEENQCEEEEEAIRLLFAKMGVKTDVEDDSKKRQKQAERAAERERAEN